MDHHYTANLLNASAVAVNAGTCLEDANSANDSQNGFNSLGNAVAEVVYTVIKLS